ncbi:MAG: glycoside hydrolase family 16 protein [Bacillota bacterium]
MGKGKAYFSIGILSLITLLTGVSCSSTSPPQLKEKGADTVDTPSNSVTHAYDVKDTPSNTEDVNLASKQEYSEGWESVWEDDFNGAGLDHYKWNIVDWAAEKNEELQYYSPNNVKVEDGFLKLIANGGRNYTSGAVNTKSKYSFLYGKVEMRAKLPKGQGMFPAFWMMTNKENTWLPEIDILEMLGHKSDEIWMVLHWLDENKKLKSVSNSIIGPDFSESFHTFGVEWLTDSIVWYIDGEERFRTTEHIPKEEMYIYINTAIGGVWPGNPDETTEFPTFYEIDYVRVYQYNGR